MELTEKDREGLLRILAWEEAYPDLLAHDTYLGWTWEDVRVWPATLNRLVHQGLVWVKFHSNSSRNMLLTEEGRAMATALRQEAEGGQDAPTESGPDETGPVALPEAPFATIAGHDDVKELLHAALAAERPVHVLLAGPPALAKSLFLWEIERALGDAALWVVGSATSQAGLWDLVGQWRPRALLVDELDKLRGPDQAALLSLMEGGRLKKAKKGAGMDVALDVRVVAAANRVDVLSPELRSRFAVRRLAPYGPGEFREVVVGVLVQREGLDEAQAREVAGALAGRTQDVRDAVRVARLAPQVGVAKAVELLRL